MLFDGIPLTTPVGDYFPPIESAPEAFLLYTHHHFNILYNGDQVIYINVTTDTSEQGFTQILSEDTVGKSFEFTYSSSWIKTTIPFSERGTLTQKPSSSLEIEIHWIAIINSMILVLLLTGFLFILLVRILRADYSRYLDSDLSPDAENDYGWRLIHAWVFRFPSHISLFSALVGLGTQCLCIFFGLLFLAFLGLFLPSTGGSVSLAAIILYALTSGIAGYVAATFYTQMGGKKWSWNAVLTSTLFIGPFGLIFIFLNSLAKYYDATVDIPLGSILRVLFVWLFCKCFHPTQYTFLKLFFFFLKYSWITSPFYRSNNRKEHSRYVSFAYQKASHQSRQTNTRTTHLLLAPCSNAHFRVSPIHFHLHRNILSFQHHLDT